MNMATGPRYRVHFRRHRSGKTDYRHRLNQIISRTPRLVVRKSNRHIRAQLIVTGKEGDTTLAAATSLDLKNYGYSGYPGNAMAAYFTGLLLGYRAKKSGNAEAILDLGPYVSTKGGNVYAVLKGAVDAGLDMPHDKSVFPAEDRIRGKHIAQYRKVDLPALFDGVKAKIQAEFK